jgi:hypothetical protein
MLKEQIHSFTLTYERDHPEAAQAMAEVRLFVNDLAENNKKGIEFYYASELERNAYLQNADANPYCNAFLGVNRNSGPWDL